MHGEIDASVEQRAVEFRREEVRVRDPIERRTGIAIAPRFDGLDLYVDVRISGPQRRCDEPALRQSEDGAT